MNCSRILGGVALVLTLLSYAPSISAQTGGDAQRVQKETSNANVLITFRMGSLEGGKRVPIKSYTLVVADGTVGSKLLSGQRMPFPMAGSGGDDSGETQVVYQNVGFHAEARAWVVNEKTIKLVAELEDSRIREDDHGAPPVVETRQLAVNAMLADGVPLELTRVEVEDQSGFVEVEARVVR